MPIHFVSSFHLICLFFFLSSILFLRIPLLRGISSLIKKNAVPLESHIANISPERDYGPNLSEADYARPIYLIRFELI